ncbi:MAG: hypothetical protein ACE15C_09175 [Phycisphaerae bacterium]
MDWAAIEANENSEYDSGTYGGTALGQTPGASSILGYGPPGAGSGALSRARNKGYVFFLGLYEPSEVLRTVDFYVKPKVVSGPGYASIVFDANSDDVGTAGAWHKWGCSALSSDADVYSTDFPGSIGDTRLN